MPKVGELYELGTFFNPEDEASKMWAHASLRLKFKAEAGETGIIFGPMMFETLEADSKRIIESPTEQGQKYLVAWAEAIGEDLGDTQEERTFVGELTDEDVEKMRISTRAAHQKNYPDEPRLTDTQCDVLIGKIGLGMVEREMS